ncbi:hypothetical protein LCGC14_1294360, partial [marine sediment metagenome]
MPIVQYYRTDPSYEWMRQAYNTNRAHRLLRAEKRKQYKLAQHKKNKRMAGTIVASIFSGGAASSALAGSATAAGAAAGMGSGMAGVAGLGMSFVPSATAYGATMAAGGGALGAFAAGAMRGSSIASAIADFAEGGDPGAAIGQIASVFTEGSVEERELIRGLARQSNMTEAEFRQQMGDETGRELFQRLTNETMVAEQQAKQQAEQSSSQWQREQFEKTLGGLGYDKRLSDIATGAVASLQLEAERTRTDPALSSAMRE